MGVNAIGFEDMFLTSEACDRQASWETRAVQSTMHLAYKAGVPSDMDEIAR